MEGVGPVLVHMFRERRFYAFFFLLRQIAFWKSVTMDILVFTFFKCIMKSRFFVVAFLCNITPFWKVTTTFWKALWHLLEWRYNAFIRVIIHTLIFKKSVTVLQELQNNREKKKPNRITWFFKRILIKVSFWLRIKCLSSAKILETWYTFSWFVSN